MRRLLFAAAAAVGMTITPFTAGVAAADTLPGPPFVERAVWVHWGDLSTLRVYPTAAGREAAHHVDTVAQADSAWTEVVTLAPDAVIPGMHEQFMCHWQFAEFAQPGKTSWNLEPWRPEVDDRQIVATRCNPGGTEEPF
jgi:hypothetical protein